MYNTVTYILIVSIIVSNCVIIHLDPYDSISTLYIVTSVFHVQSALFSHKIESTDHLGRISLHARHAGHAIACATIKQCN